MALNGLRKRFRALTGGGSDAAEGVRKEGTEVVRKGGEVVKRRAPKTDLEGNRKPEKSAKEVIAERLQDSGQMRKPIQDANLEPGSDPRYMEKFARGDEHSGEWFGESEERGDPYQSYFATGDDADGMEFGPFVQEMLDERDHEGGHYAYEDDNETGLLDDGASFAGVGSGVDFRW
jgi:hypothetical protein